MLPLNSQEKLVPDSEQVRKNKAGGWEKKCRLWTWDTKANINIYNKPNKITKPLL